VYYILHKRIDTLSVRCHTCNDSFLQMLRITYIGAQNAITDLKREVRHKDSVLPSPNFFIFIDDLQNKPCNCSPCRGITVRLGSLSRIMPAAPWKTIFCASWYSLSNEGTIILLTPAGLGSRPRLAVQLKGRCFPLQVVVPLPTSLRHLGPLLVL